EGYDRTNYPIAMSVDDLGEGFSLVAQTDQRIDPHRMLSYLGTAVKSLIDALEHSPHTPALMLEMLPEADRHEVLEAFNATEMPYPEHKLLHELIEEQVERTPDAIAVVHADQRLTYAELNALANRLAWYLRA